MKNHIKKGWQHALGIDIDVPDDFGNWLAGFVDGEATFDIDLQNVRTGGRGITCRFRISLREDDKDILYTIRDMIGVGKIFPRRARGDSAPQLSLCVKRISDIVLVIVPLFEKYPLRAKKKRDFELWAQAARMIYCKLHLTSPGRATVLELKRRIEAERRYHPPEEKPADC